MLAPARDEPKGEIACERRSELTASQVQRLVVCVLLPLAEYVVLGTLVDGTAITRRPGHWSMFGNVGNLVTLSATVLTAGLTPAKPRSRRTR